MDDLLFYRKGRLSEYLESRKQEIQNEIMRLDPDYVLKVSETDFAQYLTAKYSLPSLKLLEEHIYQHDPQDAQIDVSHNPFYGHQRQRVNGTSITVSIPFEGQGELFQYQPSHFNLNPPRGVIKNSELRVTYQFITPDSGQLTSAFQSDLQNIKVHVNWVNQNVNEFNNSLRRLIPQSIGKRKAKLLADRKVSAALGVPLKRREDAAKSYTVPLQPKRLSIQRPRVPTDASYEPEPALDEVEYKRILQTIQNMVTVMERSPHAFQTMGEEDIRTHILVSLNAQYEGGATAETFNSQGKTDILIRVKGRNIFIAECKFWKGPKSLTKTIDQLLSYTSWRDTKTAIILFNRGTNFSTVLTKIPDVMSEHPCHKRTVGKEQETIFRYVFHQPDDPNRELLLTVLAFNVPTVEETGNNPHEEATD